MRGDKSWSEANSEVEEEILEVKTNSKDTICSSCDTKKYPQYSLAQLQDQGGI